MNVKSLDNLDKAFVMLMEIYKVAVGNDQFTVVCAHKLLKGYSSGQSHFSEILIAQNWLRKRMCLSFCSKMFRNTRK